MSELRPDLLRRVLVVFQWEGCDSLFWRFEGDPQKADSPLEMHVICSDFFGWACSDCEEIETEADVEMLEQARLDLIEATGEPFPLWIGELYAARRRKMQPASFMFGDGKYAMESTVQPLFRAAGPQREPHAGLLPTGT